MLTRAWILETLAKLPVWTWPLFLIEVWAFERYYRAYRAANPIGMLGIGVLANGRIVIKLQVAGKPEGERGSGGADWTGLAPRAPWQRLAPGAALASVLEDPAKHRACTLGAPPMHCRSTVLALATSEPARPLAPP